MRVVATAGHVDHGKSSLVLALTGTDPDRFEEEKRRGLTIDLGFAFADLPSGRTVGFVDVPGHVRFAKNMLAGVGAADVALLVVAATEGWMPQTEEHLQVLDLLDIRWGAIALTKRDLVDDETAGLARLELEERLAGSTAEAWPVIEVDSRTGRGVEKVRTALDAVLAAAPPPVDTGRPRVWVDRVFARRGVGTVVTGTLTGGSIRVGADVEVGGPALPARVRGIESRGAARDEAAPGERVALNLAGVGHSDIARGDAVVSGGSWQRVRAVDVALRLLPDVTLPRRSALDVHVGSADLRARVRVLDDAERFARLHLDGSAPLAPGDRLLLRSSARRAVIGVAEILDVRPARRTIDACARLALPLGERLLAVGWQTPRDFEISSGLSADAARALADQLCADGRAVRLDGWLVDAQAVQEIVTRAATPLDVHHREHPESPGLPLASLASTLRIDAPRLRVALGSDASFTVDRELVRRSSHETTTAIDPAARAFLDALSARPFDPPSPAELGVPATVVRALAREGRVVDAGGVWFSADALERAGREVAAALREKGSLTVSEIRDLLGSSRKYVVPIAGWLDAQGVTRRRGDERVPGPRVDQVG